MSSLIDATLPEAVNPSTADVRSNFLHAKTEIETLQDDLDALSTHVDAVITGTFHVQGPWDASGGLFPTTSGSGTAGAIKKGDSFYITVGGTLGGEDITPGSQIAALVDTPGQTSGNWLKLVSLSDISEVTHAATSKTTPVDADEFAIVDSAAGNILKKLSFSNLKAALLTYISGAVATLTNKRLVRRTLSINTGLAIAVSVDDYDIVEYLNTDAINVVTIAISGTPNHGDITQFDFKSTAAHTISFGANIIGTGTLTLPATLTGSDKIDQLGVRYNALLTKHVLAYVNFGA